MKKFAFGIVVLTIGISFGIQAPSIFAAGNTVTGTISSQEAATIQQEINNLKSVLGLLQQRAAQKLGATTPVTVVVPQTPENLVAAQTSLNALKSSLANLGSQINTGVTPTNRTVLSSNLEAVKTSLLALNSSLVGATKVVPQKTVAVAPVANTEKSVTPPPTQPMTETMPAFQSQVLGQEENQAQNNQQAAVATTARKSLPWSVGIIVLVLAAATIALAWMRSRKERNMKTVTASTQSQTQYQKKSA